MSRIKLPGCALLLLVLAGCSWVTKFDELQKMADAECVKHQTGDYAEPVEQDVFTCRLLTPAAWKFKCVKKEEAERTDQ